MVKKNLVIVESPAKAKTIEKILGKKFHVVASFGHVRDLPKSKLGVDVENSFKPNYVINKDKKEEEIKPDKSFELELWTWDEYEVPTLQTRSRYSHPQYSKYIYDIASHKLTEVAPRTC